MTPTVERLPGLLVALACALTSGAQAAPGVHTEPAAVGELAASRGDLEKDRTAARGRLIANLEELAAWCGKKKLYASRVGVYESLLHFDAEHTEALRGLGYKRGRDGAWTPPKKPKTPKDWDKSAARAFPEKRSEVVLEYRDEMLGLLEKYSEQLDEASREAVYADILFADPDDAKVHELLGEVKVGEQWVLVETSRAKEEREEMNAALQAAFASVPVAQESEPNEREEALGIEWTTVYGTPLMRSIGTGEKAEVERVIKAMHAAKAYFNTVLVKEGAEDGGANYPESMTVFTLTRASDKLAFLMGHPAIEGAYRKFLMDLDGSGIRDTGDFAHWAPDEARRIDGLVRQGIAWLLADEYGIGLKQGWLFEGFGLYMTRQLLGTRLTWFVRESKYLTPKEDQALKARLMDSRTNWMNEAQELFTKGKPTNLNFLLGKNVNQLTTEDMLYSYVLAAYLLEAEQQKLPELLGKIGAGTTSQVAFEEVLHLDTKRLDLRVQRWLTERR